MARQARAAALLARVGGELGDDLARCTLDAFDVRRKLPSDITWWAGKLPLEGGETRAWRTYTPSEQRLLLSRARGIARSYASTEHLYLFGPNGSGKSHLAAAILLAQAAAGVPGSYRTMPELLALLQQGFDDNSSSARLDALLRVPLLVIDELGAEKESAWVDQTLFTLLNTRINHHRATIITSNIPPEQQRDPRIVSRLLGEFMPVPIISYDYRRMRAEDWAQSADLGGTHP